MAVVNHGQLEHQVGIETRDRIRSSAIGDGALTAVHITARAVSAVPDLDTSLVNHHGRIGQRIAHIVRNFATERDTVGSRCGEDCQNREKKQIMQGTGLIIQFDYQSGGCVKSIRIPKVSSEVTLVQNGFL
jgi:hypothetical protein